jgi:hypothetical protein
MAAANTAVAVLHHAAHASNACSHVFVLHARRVPTCILHIVAQSGRLPEVTVTVKLVSSGDELEIQTVFDDAMECADVKPCNPELNTDILEGCGMSEQTLLVLCGSPLPHTHTHTHTCAKRTGARLPLVCGRQATLACQAISTK